MEDVDNGIQPRQLIILSENIFNEFFLFIVLLTPISGAVNLAPFYSIRVLIGWSSCRKLRSWVHSTVSLPRFHRLMEAARDNIGHYPRKTKERKAATCTSLLAPSPFG
jgi:hypothetical protein